MIAFICALLIMSCSIFAFFTDMFSGNIDVYSGNTELAVDNVNVTRYADNGEGIVDRVLEDSVSTSANIANLNPGDAIDIRATVSCVGGNSAYVRGVLAMAFQTSQLAALRDKVAVYWLDDAESSPIDFDQAVAKDAVAATDEGSLPTNVHGSGTEGDPILGVVSDNYPADTTGTPAYSDRFVYAGLGDDFTVLCSGVKGENNVADSSGVYHGDGDYEDDGTVSEIFVHFGVYIIPEDMTWIEQNDPDDGSNLWQGTTIDLQISAEGLQYRNNHNNPGVPSWDSVNTAVKPIAFTESVITGYIDSSGDPGYEAGNAGDTFTFPLAEDLGKWRVLAVDPLDPTKKLIIKDLPLSEKEMSTDGQTGSAAAGQAIYFHTDQSTPYFLNETDDGYGRSQLKESIDNYYRNFVARTKARQYVLPVDLQLPTFNEWSNNANFSTYTDNGYYNDTRFETKHSVGIEQAFALSHGDIRTTMGVPVSQSHSPLLGGFTPVSVTLPSPWSYGITTNDYFIRSPRHYPLSNQGAALYWSNSLAAYASAGDPAWLARPALWIETP
ncbi:MAG: hypothetical protein ABF515_05215 [Bifidobacterium sp.]